MRKAYLFFWLLMMYVSIFSMALYFHVDVLVGAVASAFFLWVMSIMFWGELSG